MKGSCGNCKNGKQTGKVVRCSVTGRVKTKPFTPCDNYNVLSKEEEKR